jgi:hypothetical protein
MPNSENIPDNFPTTQGIISKVQPTIPVRPTPATALHVALRIPTGPESRGILIHLGYRTEKH